jgi:hypothetical protein
MNQKGLRNVDMTNIDRGENRVCGTVLELENPVP